MASIKVGIVEDEALIGRGIQKTLRELGYTGTSPAISYDAAIRMIESEKPDILLIDIMLSGPRDGIDLAWKVKEDYNIPFIFLTANSDAATVERAKKVCPPAYLVKPFKKNDLYTSIEVCLHNYSSTAGTSAVSEKENYIIKDSLFVKHNGGFIKLKLDEITYIESERVYVYVHTRTDKFLIRSGIQHCLDIIASTDFVRVHKSFVINTAHLDAINAESVTICGQEIRVGKVYRDQLLNILKTRIV